MLCLWLTPTGWLTIMALLGLATLAKVAWEHRTPRVDSIPQHGDESRAVTDDEDEDIDDDEDEEVDEEDEELARKIRSVHSRDELMQIVDEYEFIGKEAADALLERALSLDLSPDDWSEIYDVSEDDSELEEEASERMGE